MFITQPYTLHHAILYLSEFTGHQRNQSERQSERQLCKEKELNTGFSTEVQ